MKKYIILLIVLAISIYAMVLRFDKLANHELWSDEINQLNTMNEGFRHMLKVLPTTELSSYLNLDHFLMYPFFRIFHFNKWALAIPHAISTILGLYLLYLICRRYFNTLWGYVITFGIVCFNATLINHATEIRPYAVLPTLALACLYASEILIRGDNLSPGKKFLIGSLFLLTVCFHTYGVFILFFCLLYALLNRPQARTFGSIFKDTFKILVVILSIGMPFWIFCVFGPLRHPVESYKLDVFTYIPDPATNAIGFLKSVFGNLVGFKKFYFILIAMIFPFVLPFKERRRQISFLIIMVFLPMMAVFVSDLAVRYYFIQRQFVWVMPYFAIFLGWSCDSFISYIYALRGSLHKEII